MNKPLRVLLVEDSEEDAIILLHELKQGGYEPVFLRVYTALAFGQAMDFHKWDVVICDYLMPNFDGISALRLFKEKSVDIPFIVVSGMIGEDVAVGMMTAGVHDYILKHNLARLVPAIERELREAEDRRAHRRTEEERSHLAAIVESSDDGVIGTVPEGLVMSWNRGAEKIFGYTLHEAVGRPIQFLVAPSEQGRVVEMFRQTMQGERVYRLQTTCVRKDSKPVDVSLTISEIKNSTGRIIGVSAIVRDITEWRRAEAEREKLLRELQEAGTQIRTLSGLLPICSSCKKIRDNGGYWHQVEIYIQKHSQAAFTHGLCPDCLNKLYPDYMIDRYSVPK